MHKLSRFAVFRNRFFSQSGRILALTLVVSAILLSCAPTSPTATPAPAPSVPATTAPPQPPTAVAPPAALVPTPPVATPTVAATPVPTATAATATAATATPAAAPTPPVLLVPPPGAARPDAVDSTTASFESEGFNIKAYLAKPKGSGTFPAMLIIHENRGLTPHQEDVARRFANQGYVALAVDLLSRVGGTSQFATAETAVAAIGGLSSSGVMKDAEAAVKYLQTLPYVKKDKIGVIGYCWGGGNSLLFATRNRDIKAAVVYYGPNPANLDEVATVTAPILGLYGSEDPRITVNVPKLDETMKKYNKSFEYKVYQGAFHAFFNDTGARYHPEASADSWKVTLAFLEKHLK